VGKKLQGASKSSQGKPSSEMEQNSVEALAGQLRTVVCRLRDDIDDTHGDEADRPAYKTNPFEENGSHGGGGMQALESDIEFVQLWFKALVGADAQKASVSQLDAPAQKAREKTLRDKEAQKLLQLEQEAIASRQVALSKKLALERARQQAALAQAQQEYEQLLLRDLQREEDERRQREQHLRMIVEQQRLAALHAESEALSLQQAAKWRAMEAARQRAERAEREQATREDGETAVQLHLRTPQECVDEMRDALRAKFNAFCATFRLPPHASVAKKIEKVMVQAAVLDCAVQLSASQVCLVFAMTSCNM
jgi:hypothetical protein